MCSFVDKDSRLLIVVAMLAALVAGASSVILGLKGLNVDAGLRADVAGSGSSVTPDVTSSWAVFKRGERRPTFQTSPRTIGMNTRARFISGNLVMPRSSHRESSHLSIQSVSKRCPGAARTESGTNLSSTTLGPILSLRRRRHSSRVQINTAFQGAPLGGATTVTVCHWPLVRTTLSPKLKTRSAPCCRRIYVPTKVVIRESWFVMLKLADRPPAIPVVTLSKETTT